MTNGGLAAWRHGGRADGGMVDGAARGWVGSLLSVVALVVMLSTPAAGQFIALKTVPVASGDQFLLFPSRNLGMGGVGIALNDSVLDPFVNPAKGARTPGSHVFAAPVYYNISDRAGSGGSLPLGAQFGGKWFGGGLVALQELKRGDEFFGPQPFWEDIPPGNALASRTATNKYAQLLVGTKLLDDLALGASGFFADLNAIDGVEHLYAMASSIRQSGNMKDLRLGMTKDFNEGRSFEAMGLYRRFDMRHDVVYVDWVLVDSTNRQWEEQVREENNLDVTDTWGVHLGYQQPIGGKGWRVGGILTGNWKSHPKIPNYEIMNIPRDPGNSTAFEIGVGIAKAAGAATFGIDIVYQPGTSDTWAEAEAPLPTVSGDTIPVGEKTIENEFSFSNAMVNMGAGYTFGPAAFQFGLGLRSYDYHLDQWDHVEEDARRQDEQWMEWVPSWGVQVRLADLEIRYLGRLTTGTGRPGIAWDGAVVARAEVLSAANDILLAPEGPLTLQDVTVFTNQISISIPIR